MEETGVCSNSGLDSSIIITVNKSETGVPDPVTSSVTGDPVASLSTCEMLLGSSAETNVTTPVAGTELEVRTGQRVCGSYENAAPFVCVEASRVENLDRQSCWHEQRKLPGLEDGQSCCHGQRKLPGLENVVVNRARQSCCHQGQRKLPGVASSCDCRAVLCGPVNGHMADCCATHVGSITSKGGMPLLGPAVEEDCCVLAGDDTLPSLGPTVPVKIIEHSMFELPVKSTAKTG